MWIVLYILPLLNFCITIPKDERKLTPKFLPYKMETWFSKISENISEMKDVIIKNLISGNKRLQEGVHFLESEQFALEQYSRRNNNEISGITNSVPGDNSRHYRFWMQLISKSYQTWLKLVINFHPEQNLKLLLFVNRKICETANKTLIKLLSALAKMTIFFQRELVSIL